MAVDQQPRVGFKYLGIPPWNEATWRELETLLDVPAPSPAAREEIEHHVCMYLAAALPRQGRAPQYVRTRGYVPRIGTRGTVFRRGGCGYAAVAARGRSDGEPLSGGAQRATCASTWRRPASERLRVLLRVFRG